MKKFKEIIVFFLICFASYVIMTFALNQFVFKIDYLINGFFVSFGSTIGYFAYYYFHNKK